MSGEFRPEQNQRIEATDDPELAKAHGLTQYDKATGQWRAPQPPDAGQRDGADVQEQRHADALAEGDAQHEAEHGAPPANGDKTDDKATPAKRTGAKAKADDSK